MAEVEIVIPTPGRSEVGTLVPALREAQRGLRPFDARVVDFVADLSSHLRKDPTCRAEPAIVALAFWIRPANIKRLEDEWKRLSEQHERVVFVPRGVVFHMPPTNVDTLFVYSWLLSALVGNSNVIRLSASAGEQTSLVLRAINHVLQSYPEVAENVVFARYGHEREITAALSAADVRVIWGGNETVNAVRAIPMNPYGTELAFADRYSMSAIDAQAMLALDSSAFADFVHRFYSDAYWFDQLGCSSPRSVFWRGEADVVENAQQVFLDELKNCIEKQGYESQTGAVMNKLVRSAALAADDHVSEINWQTPEITVVSQDADAPLDRDGPGAGLFSFRRIDSLNEVAAIARRSDQTLSHFGFTREELTKLAFELNGAGIDRIVPVGQALQFDRFWDGFDLLESFCRRVAVDG